VFFCFWKWRNSNFVEKNEGILKKWTWINPENDNLSRDDGD
jgi:hypothetical protein